MNSIPAPEEREEIFEKMIEAHLPIIESIVENEQ